MTNRALVAATIHRHLCVCPKHGYTQGGGRWGQGPNGPCYVEIEGRTYEIPGNDFDCSSSVKKAWELALIGSPYEGVLGYNGYDQWGNWRSWYTGNERELFVGSGLFTWEPMSFIADTGDLYLNEANHVAMCQTQYPDVLSEFLSNEWGGITGGQVGDQTGGESVVRAFWWSSFGWDGILHYNGKADEDMDPAKIWEYNYEGTAPEGNMYNTLCAIYKAVTGHGISSWAYMNPSEKVDAYYVLNETNRNVKALMAAGGIEGAMIEIDYDKLADAVSDKLADAVADKLAARLKD